MLYQIGIVLIIVVAAIILKNDIIHNTNKTTVLTCPADATLIVKSIYCANNDASSAILVHMNIKDSSDSKPAFNSSNRFTFLFSRSFKLNLFNFEEKKFTQLFTLIIETSLLILKNFFSNLELAIEISFFEKDLIEDMYIIREEIL